MAKLTTVKPIALGYRAVGSDDAYTPLMGVLKGLSVGQDEPDSTSIDAEFYDSPFDIFYDGSPIVMNFELANYDLEELPDLFGGEIDNADDYEGETNAYTSEWEWKLDFSRGYSSLVIVRGLTEGTIKKDADGALNFSVTITALAYRDTSVTPAKDVMYKILKFREQPPTDVYLDFDDSDDAFPQNGKVIIPNYIAEFDNMTVHNVPSGKTLVFESRGERNTLERDGNNYVLSTTGTGGAGTLYYEGQAWLEVVVQVPTEGISFISDSTPVTIGQDGVMHLPQQPDNLYIDDELGFIQPRPRLVPNGSYYGASDNKTGSEDGNTWEIDVTGLTVAQLNGASVYYGQDTVWFTLVIDE